MGWVDSHCHLDFEVFKPELLFPQLQAQGCEGVLIPATDVQSFDGVIALRQEYPSLVRVALGLHPYFIHNHNEKDVEILEQAIRTMAPDAVGEFGLDFMLDASTFDKQYDYFNQQLALAKSYKMPLVIHCRKAHDQLLSRVIKARFHQGGFIHGFSGSIQQAKRYLDHGFVLGLGGALTYERAKAMHKMVAALPDDGYTLETDSPDMPPSFARDQVNTPLNAPVIAQYIADLRGQTLEQVLKDSTENFYRVFSR